MLLVIDIGNTNIVFGLYQKEELLNYWRVATDSVKTRDEYGLIFKSLIREEGIDANRIESAVISSVVPKLSYTIKAMCENYFTDRVIVVGVGTKTGMPIKYDNPKEVGADRIVNSVAAYQMYKCPLIVVDSGTAITFDCIDENGTYLGGAIAPGLGIASDALFTRTSKLPKIDLVYPASVIGKSTQSAMQAGIVIGYIGLIDHLIEKIKAEMGYENIKVIATGGFSSLIMSESKHIEAIEPLLTLIGLRLIYEKNM